MLLLNAKFSWERKKLHLSDKIILNCNQFTSRRKKDIGAFTEICIGVNEDILFSDFFKNLLSAFTLLKAHGKKYSSQNYSLSYKYEKDS